jgi:hypothetical protein
VKSIQERDLKNLKLFYQIFEMIQREQEFQTYYFNERKNSLVQLWNNVQLIDCTTTSTTTTTMTSSNNSNSNREVGDSISTFSQFLTNYFYPNFLQLLKEETDYYLVKIFPKPFKTLSKLIVIIFESFTTSLPQRLDQIVKFHNNNNNDNDNTGLLELIKVFKSTEEFAVQVELIFTRLTTTTSQAHQSQSQSQTHERRSSLKQQRSRSLSKRLSSRSISFALGTSPLIGSEDTVAIQGQGGGDHSDDGEQGGQVDLLTIKDWEISLFEPFLDYQVEFPRFERNYLETEISHKLNYDNDDWLPQQRQRRRRRRGGNGGNGGNGNGAKILLERSFTILNGLFLRDSLQRNFEFTHGYGSQELIIKVLDRVFENFFEKRKNELERFNATHHNNKLITDTNDEGEEEEEEEEEEEVVIEGLEYSSQDWEIFTFGLKLLDSCKQVQLKLDLFETRLKDRLTSLYSQGGFDKIVPPGTTRGEISLLKQSSLNSLELNQLLKSSSSSSSSLSLSLMKKSRKSLLEFTKTSQVFLHSTILSPLESHLSLYSNLNCWTQTQTSQSQSQTQDSSSDLTIPTFSSSPTELISRVGEGLFNLPRLFEVYAQDDALGYSLQTLPFIQLETSSSSSSSSLSLSLSAETVISTWLSSLTLSILFHLTRTILPKIQRLTKQGSLQLSSDLDYISNVAKTLDVEPIPKELQDWISAVAMDDEKLLLIKTNSSSSNSGGAGQVEGVEKEILDRVIKIRGIRK